MATKHPTTKVHRVHMLSYVVEHLTLVTLVTNATVLSLLSQRSRIPNSHMFAEIKMKFPACYASLKTKTNVMARITWLPLLLLARM